MKITTIISLITLTLVSCSSSNLKIAKTSPENLERVDDAKESVATVNRRRVLTLLSDR